MAMKVTPANCWWVYVACKKITSSPSVDDIYTNSTVTESVLNEQERLP